MFEPIPEPSASSDYLRIKENEKHRIRIMGSSKEPATFIQGWEAWGNDNKPVRAQYELGKPCPQSLKDIDRDGKPKLFWMFIVWHVDLEKPMVFEVTQQTIKSAILSHTNNKAWGDPANYVLEIGRTGTGMETEYTVIAEPPVEPPAKSLASHSAPSLPFLTPKLIFATLGSGKPGATWICPPFALNAAISSANALVFRSLSLMSRLVNSNFFLGGLYSADCLHDEEQYKTVYLAGVNN